MKALNARKSAQAKKLIPPNDPNEINDPKLQTASNKPSEMVALGSLKFNIEPNAKFTKTADAIVAGNRPAWSLPRLAAPYLSIGLIIRPRFWPAKICMCKC